MGALLVPLIIVVILLVIVGMGVRSWSARRHQAAVTLAGPEPTLDYVVPTGQDPAVVLTALSGEGYTATPDPGRPPLLHISCPAGPDRDRAHVRATIASVHTTGIDTGAPMEPEVRFVDEE